MFITSPLPGPSNLQENLQNLPPLLLREPTRSRGVPGQALQGNLPLYFVFWAQGVRSKVGVGCRNALMMGHCRTEPGLFQVVELMACVSFSMNVYKKVQQKSLGQHNCHQRHLFRRHSGGQGCADLPCHLQSVMGSGSCWLLAAGLSCSGRLQACEPLAPENPALRGSGNNSDVCMRSAQVALMRD